MCPLIPTALAGIQLNQPEEAAVDQKKDSACKRLLLRGLRNIYPEGITAVNRNSCWVNKYIFKPALQLMSGFCD